MERQIQPDKLGMGGCDVGYRLALGHLNLDRTPAYSHNGLWCQSVQKQLQLALPSIALALVNKWASIELFGLPA